MAVGLIHAPMKESKFEAEEDSLLHVEEYPRIGNKSS